MSPAGKPSKPRRKAVNLPRITRDSVDLAHILEGHTAGGERAGSSKTMFPEGWTERDIETAILNAYNGGRKVATQGSRVRVKGEAGGIAIEMWVNLETRRIETAYPI
jgi:hypothetical protein